MKLDKIFNNIPIIETDRIKLRKITMDDLDDFYEYSSNPNVARYLSYCHKTKDEAVEYINNKQKEYDAGECMIWGIEHKEDKKYIGACGFTYWDRKHGVGEIAYTLSDKYWKKGLGVEAVRKILEFGFVQMNLNRIEARCWKDNENSENLMKRLNMTFEGVIREQIFVKNDYRDVKMYSILKKEYD